LRYWALDFLFKYMNEGIEEIKMQEESFEEKKVQASVSPIQRLIEKGTRNLRSFDQSELMPEIIILINKYQDNPEILVKIAEIVSVCALYRPLAQKVVDLGILKDIINLVFKTDDYRSYLVILGFDIIWNTIDSVGISALKSFATEETINELKVFFEKVMKTGYKLEDKGLRNEILILINYLMSDPQALVYFHERGTLGKSHTFLDILIYYATIDEMTFYSHPIRTNDIRGFFNTTSEDLEFKKLIWSGILTSLQSNNEKVTYMVKNVITKTFSLTFLELLHCKFDFVYRPSCQQLRCQ
jgi:hypothetical protein